MICGTCKFIVITWLSWAVPTGDNSLMTLKSIALLFGKKRLIITGTCSTELHSYTA